MKTDSTPLAPAASLPPKAFIIVLLGTLSLITPFAIDMYLPAFEDVSRDFHQTTHAVSFSLSSYFIGFAFGQIFYGPLLDRYGRKRPICLGLLVFVAASLACAFAPGLKSLIFFRLIEALGGCAAAVGATAMVRDFFSADESARVFSLIFLIIGVSPLFAPSAGTGMLFWLGWRWIFLALALLALLVVAVIWKWLPEGHSPDPGISLRLESLVKTYGLVLSRRSFTTYAFAGAFSFAGLFAYVASAPLIFYDTFHVSKGEFSTIFALVAVGFIGVSQFNVFFLRHFTSSQIFTKMLYLQVATGILFAVLTQLRLIGLWSTVVLFFIYLSCTGLIYPNAAAMALRSFTRNVGSASALLGFIQMGGGALTSFSIGFLGGSAVAPILAGSTILALIVFLIGRRGLKEEAAAPAGEPIPMVH